MQVVSDGRKIDKRFYPHRREVCSVADAGEQDCFFISRCPSISMVWWRTNVYGVS